MTYAPLPKASSYRNKYLPMAFTDPKPRTAVVVGSTSGIGQAIAHRLAEQGWNVVAVGRHREGRAEAVVSKLDEHTENTLASQQNEAIAKKINAGAIKPQHSFVSCDCFSLKSVQEASRQILKEHDSIDALVLTQGMATTQGFTPTIDGNDEKLTLHYFSRMAFASLLLPALAKSDLKQGPAVLSVLSAGNHAPFKSYQTDFSLEKSYSVSNAASAAGYYGDLGLDTLAKQNPQINFFHAAPGFVNSNWGTEFNSAIRGVVRGAQRLAGRSPTDCAEFMTGPSIFACEYGDELPPRYEGNGVICFGKSGGKTDVTKGHSVEAREFVWARTLEVFKKAGVYIAE